MKKPTRITIVLLIAAGIGVSGWLVVRWNVASRSRVEVVTRGPLDIRLWGIRPGTGDAIYDPNGKKIRDTLGIARWLSPHWGNSSQHFDFIFELPDTNKPPLFKAFPTFAVSGEGRPLGGSVAHLILNCEGKRLLWLRRTFDRTFKRPVLGGLWILDSQVDSVDVTLAYYHGPAGTSLFTLNGPFEPNSTVMSADGASNVSFTRDATIQAGAHTQFELSTSTYFGVSCPVVIYDESGGRNLTETASGRSSQQGSRIAYSVRSMPLRKISAIAFGERPHQITFKGINLKVGGRKRRSHGAYLDEMAAKLNLKLAPEELADYQFQSADDALKVIDIVRGAHILLAAETILKGSTGSGRSEPQRLDDGEREKLKVSLSRWLDAWDPEFRARAIRLGLVYDWAEFVEPALELLQNQGMPYDYKTRVAATRVSYALARYKDKLSEEAVGRIKEILLSRDDRDILNNLKGCLRWSKSQARIDALWALAEDERPWLWWDAIEKLAQWKEFKGNRDSLSDELKLRLLVVSRSRDFSKAGLIAPQAYDLLDSLLTPQLRALDLGTFNDVFRKIAGNSDRRFATGALINFLRRIEDYDRSTVYSVDKTVKHINQWHGLDIGGLGADVTRDIGDVNKYNWPEITAEAIEWYEGTKDADDVPSSAL